MHEHQNQRGRGRGRGGEHAARRGSGPGSYTDAHLLQNQTPIPYAPNSNLYNYASGTIPNYPATNQSGLNTQPASYSNSLPFVPSSVQSRYAPTNHQRRFDQPVRLYQFTLPIRTSRVESTIPDEQHKSDNQASQNHYSSIPAQSVLQPGYYGHSAPGTQVSLHAFALPIRNHRKTSLESTKIDQSNTGDLQNSYGSYNHTPQQNPLTPAYHPNMSYPYDNSQYNYAPGAAPAYQYPQQAQQSYDQNPPAIRNPFPAPPPARNAYGAQNAGYDPEQEALMAQWQSQYAPADVQAMRDARGKAENPNVAPIGQRPGAVPAAAAADSNAANPEKKVTVVRKGGGQVWEDNTLLEWDPTQFRIMVGNLAGEVTDDSLAKAFAQYGVSKARVIRDKRTTKSKGFGFVSFTDGELGFKAAREMVGKYIGSHPVTIQRSKTDLKPVVQKDKHKGKGKNNKNNNRNDKKEKKKEDDPLRAHTGAVIEKKPVKNAGGYKVIG
jgi:hypothetical protein